MSVEIVCGDARSVLAGMSAQSVQCVVTLPRLDGPKPEVVCDG